MSWQRKVYCHKCGMMIDVITTPEKKPHALAEAMILMEARASHHEETGCEGDIHGWRFGPWKEVEAENDSSS